MAVNKGAGFLFAVGAFVLSAAFSTPAGILRYVLLAIGIALFGVGGFTYVPPLTGTSQVDLVAEKVQKIVDDGVAKLGALVPADNKAAQSAATDVGKAIVDSVSKAVK